VKKYFIFVAFFLFSTSIYAAECDDKVFSNLSASKGATISQMLEQLSSKCSFSITVKDNDAEEMLNKQLNTINLRDFTLRDIFDFLLVENKLDYEYKNGILKISSYTTKTFKVDYITTIRDTTTSINLNGGAGSSGSTSSGTTTQGASNQAQTGSTMKTKDSEFDFWTQIQSEIANILNPQEAQNKNLDSNQTNTNLTNQTNTVRANNAISINRQAGLITVSASNKKLSEVEKYINTVLDRLHQQVFIDVQILSVQLTKGNTTGIDWSKIYSAIALKGSYGSYTAINQPTIDTSTGVISASTAVTTNPTFGQYFRVSGSVDLTDFIKFLKTQGNVKAVSNPKVMTLNNQPALIISGDIIYYPKVTGGTSASATTGATNPSVETVALPVGTTLDITPEIMDDNNMLLKINPTSSNCIATNCPLQTVLVAGSTYNIAPNIAQKQLSSVVKIADGERIILGGLIKDTVGTDSKSLPLFGDIPGVGYLFKQDIDTRVMEEMVIVITPHIVKKDKPLSLKELGYKSDFDK